MQPIEPKEVIDGFEKVWVGPPADDTGIPVDGVWAQFAWEEPAPPMYAVLMEFSDDDLELIKANGGRAYLVQVTSAMVPFSFQHITDLPHQPPTS